MWFWTTVQYVFYYYVGYLIPFPTSSMLFVSYDNEFRYVFLIAGQFPCGVGEFFKVSHYKACAAPFKSRKCSIPFKVFSMLCLSEFDSRLSNSMIRSCTTLSRRCSCRRRSTCWAVGLPFPLVGGLGLRGGTLNSERNNSCFNNQILTDRSWSQQILYPDAERFGRVL